MSETRLSYTALRVTTLIVATWGMGAMLAFLITQDAERALRIGFLSASMLLFVELLTVVLNDER